MKIPPTGGLTVSGWQEGGEPSWYINGLHPAAGGDAQLKAGVTPLRCVENNGELHNNLLVLSPRWIVNPAAHDEDFGKYAVIVQFSAIEIFRLSPYRL